VIRGAGRGDQEARQLWLVVYAGRDPLTGRKRQKTGTARTKAEARQLEARLVQEAGGGQHLAAGSQTVGELLEA
jgi:hypothetical protein